MFNQCADFDFTFSFLKMNRKVEFASDELFDLTSGSSGEEYIPHSSEDSSEGTDTSEVIQPVNQKESMLRFPILGKYADIGELNDVSSKQILNRGRSPSRRGGNSGMRHKRQCPSSSRRASYPTTHAHMQVVVTQQNGVERETLNLYYRIQHLIWRKIFLTVPLPSIQKM